MDRAVASLGAASSPTDGPAAPRGNLRDAPLWPGGRYRRGDRDDAIAAGLRWLAARAGRAGPGDLSDYLQVFQILQISAADPDLRWAGRILGRRAARRYLKNVARPRSTDSLEKLFDHAAAAVILPDLGQPAPRYRRRVIAALRGRHVGQQLDARQSNSAGRLLDQIVDLFFLYRLGLPLRPRFARIVERAAAFPLRMPGGVPLRAIEDRTYLVTHIVYVLSNFNQCARPAARFPRLLRYLRAAVPLYLAAGDTETLGELGDTMRILGQGFERPELRSLTAHLIAAQRADGGWAGPKARDEYARYHTTWTAFNGLLAFRFPRIGPIDPRIARAWRRGRDLAQAASAGRPRSPPRPSITPGH